MLTDEQKSALIADAMDEITDAVIEKAKESATWTTQNAVKQEVSTIVKDFFDAEIGPEIKLQLTAHKEQILSAAIASAEQMAIALSEAMTAALVENVGSSYKRKKILEAMFD